MIDWQVEVRKQGADFKPVPFTLESLEAMYRACLEASANPPTHMVVAEDGTGMRLITKNHTTWNMYDGGLRSCASAIQRFHRYNKYSQENND